MSRHISRKDRWNREGPGRYVSALRKVVYEQRAWYAVLEYRTIVAPQREGGLPGWKAHSARLGPFKRPRNAMVALEEEATFLKNRHGDGIRFSGQEASGG
jgi:hypothetical protein